MISDAAHCEHKVEGYRFALPANSYSHQLTNYVGHRYGVRVHVYMVVGFSSAIILACHDMQAVADSDSRLLLKAG